MLVGGEPGIGKTRLTSELAVQAREVGWCVVTGRAYQPEGMPPYLPFIEAIREILHGSAPDGLGTLPGGGGEVLARLVPELRGSLSDAAQHPPLSPEAERYRLHVSVSDFLVSIARAQAGAGLLLVLEDLHWADAPALQLLLHLARQLSGAPLLIAGTYRTTERGHPDVLSAVLADLRREAPDGRLLLSAMSLQEVATLIGRWTARPPTPEVVEAVYRKSEGNPFFVGEVVRHLIAEGRDLSDGGTAVEQWGIPEGVREVIGRRLDRLSAQTNQMLGAAAVQGDGLSPDLLAALTELDTDALGDALDEAIAAGMLREAGDGFQFTHALIRETLYAGLSLPRRQRLHLRAAEAIEEVYTRGLSRHLTNLARHYRLAGTAASRDKARYYALRAAEAAHAVFAWEVEAGHLDEALTLTDEEDREARCDLLLSIGAALRAAGQPLRAAEEAAPAAYTLAEALGDGSRAIRACVLATQALLAYGSGVITGARRFHEWAERADRWAMPGSPERARADLLLLYALFGAARFREAGALLPRLLTYIRERSGPAEQGEMVAQILALNPSPADGARHLQLVQEYGEPSQGVSINLAGWLLFYTGWIYLDWGERRRTEAAWRRLADLAVRTRDPAVLFFSLRASLIQALLDGDLAGAVAFGDELKERAAAQGSPVLSWFHSSNLVYRPLLHLGRAGEAVDRAAIPAEARALGLTVAAPSLGMPEALCLAGAGRLAEAEQDLHRWVVDRCLGAADMGTPASALVQFLETALLLDNREAVALLAERLAGAAPLAVGMTALTCIARHLGAAAARLGRRDEARRRFQQALDVTSRIGFRPEAALTRLQYAEFLATGDAAARAEALAYLDVAIGEFQAMTMQPALERAGRLRAQLGTDTGAACGTPAPAYPDGLTKREVDVLRLLAAAKSNREISAALVLSVRTVERHVENIYLKTGMHNRTQATLYAQGYHLL